MVKSLRYWLQAVGLTIEPSNGRRFQYFTDLGEIIYKKDRYIEELGTLCLLQYNLATNSSEATAWYFFFNEFLMTEFTKDDFIKNLQNFININGLKISLRSLNDDFNCIINTYLPKYKLKVNENLPENNLDCPFGELGLIDIVSKQKNIFGKREILYKKSSLDVKMIDSWIVLAIIMDQIGDNNSITLNELLSGKNNIGKIFNLDAIGLLDLLYKTEKTGKIKIIRTAGLDIVKIIEKYSFLECVNIYYENLNKSDRGYENE